MDGGNVRETPAQKALAEHASNLMADYKARWAPVQQRMIETTNVMGAPDSAQRRAATGRAAADVEARFGVAEQKAQAGLAATSGGIGSSKAKLGLGGLSLDKAAAKGQNVSLSDAAVDNAYLQGLAGIAAMGRGEKAAVSTGLTQQADWSAKQAQQDADLSLQNRMGYASLAGQAAGLGFAKKLSTPDATPAGINGGTYLPNSLRGSNNY